MALRQGILHTIERTRQDVADTAPRRVYIGAHPTLGAGNYVFRDTATEATAWLKETSADVFKFDDDSAFDNGRPLLVGTSPNTIILV